MTPAALLAPIMRLEPLAACLMTIRQLRYWENEATRIVETRAHTGAVYEDESVHQWREKREQAARTREWLRTESAGWMQQARGLYLEGKRVAVSRARELRIEGELREVADWCAAFRRNEADLCAYEDGMPEHPVETGETLRERGMGAALAATAPAPQC